MVDRKILGNKIKFRRIHKDLSVKEFALLTGISVSHLRNIENGYRFPSMSNFITICNILNVLPHELLYSYLLDTVEKGELIHQINSLDSEKLSILLDIINLVPDLCQR